jgi:hypothetical protein
MQIRVWDSESENSGYDITEDPFYVKLDGENGVFRVRDYEADGSRTTVMLFIGPDSDKNSQKWDDFVCCEDENECPDINCETEAEIRRCFDLPPVGPR